MSLSELHCEVLLSDTPILSPASACVQEATLCLLGWLASPSTVFPRGLCPAETAREANLS